MNFHYIGLAQLTTRAMAALKEATDEAANDLVAKAQEAAPYEEGTLEASIQTEGAHISGRTVEAVVHTGAEASDYAAVQHEHTEFQHPVKGQAKYIEEPLIREKPLYIEALRRAVRGVF